MKAKIQEGRKKMEKKRRVLLHISEVGNWGIIFAYITNLIKAVGEKNIQEIKILANVNSVLIANDAAAIKKIGELSSEGGASTPKIKFYFCPNSLKNFGIDPSKLPDSIEKGIAGIDFLTNPENRIGVTDVKI